MGNTCDSACLVKPVKEASCHASFTLVSAQSCCIFYFLFVISESDLI